MSMLRRNPPPPIILVNHTCRSQLLEVLLELNSSIRIPRHFRYDLTVPEELFPETNLGQEVVLPLVHCDAALAKQKFREAREQLLEGRTSAEVCERMEGIIAQCDNFAPALQYTELLKTPHTLPGPASPLGADEDVDITLGFLSPEHDLEYTSNLDSGLGFTRTGDRPFTAEREREMILRNPTSMYNWLRKHDPDVFQEATTGTAPTVAPEKPPPPPKPAATRTSKRAAAQPPKDERMFDEDTYLEPEPEVPKTAGRRRKRDEDTGYRPKGGSSGRPRKKREDAPTKRKRPAATPAS